MIHTIDFPMLNTGRMKQTEKFVCQSNVDRLDHSIESKLNNPHFIESRVKRKLFVC